MTAVLITPPTTFGVTVEQAKAQARVFDGADDDLVELHLAAALSYIEKITGVVYEPQQWRLYLDAFPTKEIELSPGPIASVETVSYVNDSGIVVPIVADGAFRLDAVGANGWLIPIGAWPTGLLDGPNSVIIDYTAGRGQMPPHIKQAVVMLAAHYYGDREGAEFPAGVDRLIGPDIRHFI